MRRSSRSAARWASGAAAAFLFAIVSGVAGTARAQVTNICVNRVGRIKGINTPCSSKRVDSLYWLTNGIPGIQGPVGPQGPAGIAGAQGPQGAQGAQGPAGPQGGPGLAGAIGATGATGPQGPVGPQGPAGAVGTVGATGPSGPNGEPGPAGLAGAIGITGPSGPQGAQGDIGLTGIAGPSGAVGPLGPSGPNGVTGVETTLLVGGNFGEDVASATGGTQLGPGGSPQFSPIYLGPNDGADVAIATVATPLPAGVLKKLFIQVDFSPGSSSESDFFSVCVNGDCVGPGISCTVIAAQTECNDPADTATINDGDTVAIRAATHSGSAHFTNVTWSLEYQH